jgi:hypothetical protein
MNEKTVKNMDNDSRINAMLQSISDNDKYNNCVFWGCGIYFVIGNGNLWEISDDAGSSPKGGWFPDIVSGPTEKEEKCLTSLMETLEFDENFFSDLLNDFGEFDEECVEEYFEENDDEDSLKIYRKIKKEIESGKIPFASVEDFICALARYGLDNNRLYYEWEGEYIDLYDNICEIGEERGYYDRMSDEEWISLLENIDKHVVTA